MKKNFFALIFAMCLICPCALIFSACGTQDHTHQYSETLSHNTTHHWAECPCGDKANVAPHDYDNDCDDTCNTCGYVRVAPHSFSDDCDTDCDVEGCDYTRTVPHDYSLVYSNDDENHWYKCSICGDKTSVSTHIRRCLRRHL